MDPGGSKGGVLDADDSLCFEPDRKHYQLISMKHHCRSLFAVAVCAAAVPSIHAQTPTPTPAGYVDAFRSPASAPLAERQTRTALRLSQRMVNGETQLLVNFRTLYNEVWHNADGLTPQQVCDALGGRAAGLFVIAGTMANALYQIDPAGLGAMVSVPAGYATAVHADGTVTLTYTPPAAGQ